MQHIYATQQNKAQRNTTQTNSTFKLMATIKLVDYIATKPRPIEYVRTKTQQNTTKHVRTQQNRTEQNNRTRKIISEQNITERNRTHYNRTHQNKTQHNRTNSQCEVNVVLMLRLPYVMYCFVMLLYVILCCVYVTLCCVFCCVLRYAF